MGFPSPAKDFAEKRLDLNDLIVNQSATFILRMTGDAMKGLGIFDNNFLIVDKSITPVHGHIVVAEYRREFLVRRLFKQKGVIELRAAHPKEPVITFKDDDELIVWGVVISTIRKFV